MTFPFRIVPPTGLPVAGYTWSTLGVFAVHRLQDGRFLRLTTHGWTKRPQAIVAAALFPTREKASRARDGFMVQMRRRAIAPGRDRRAA